jgi:hypothetical protein
MKETVMRVLLKSRSKEFNREHPPAEWKADRRSDVGLQARLDGSTPAIGEALAEEGFAHNDRRGFELIREDIDCHKSACWVQDPHSQPKRRPRYRAILELGYTDAHRQLHPGLGDQLTFLDYPGQAFKHSGAIRIDHFFLSPYLAKAPESCEIDKGPPALEKPWDHTPIVMRLTLLSVYG